MNNKVVVCGIDTSKLKKLSATESLEYLKRIQNGDKLAREEFIACSMRLVLSVCKRFANTKINMDDLFQAGCIGLIKAVDNFDLKFGVCFATYSVPMIVGEIKRIIRCNNSLKVARSIRDNAYLILQERGKIEKEGLDPTIELISNRLKMATKEVAFTLDAISDTVSLYDPVFNKNGDEILLVDRICDEKNNDDKWTENVALSNAINGLNKREKEIIYLRYYVGKTQTEISQQVGISQAQVSRIEKEALKEIKNSIY